MRLLALDFDGVISDSAPEAFVVAVRTYAAMRPETSISEVAAPLLAEGSAPAAGVVESAPLYARFLELMPLGNRAEDYGVVLHAIDAGRPLDDQQAYDAFRDSLDRDWLRAFHKRFYRVRAALADADPSGWRALIGPYEPLLSLLRRRAGDAVFAVATAKDRHSVAKLIASYGVGDLLPPERVFDKDTGVTKDAHLARLREMFGFDYPEMTFVDDKVNHLDVVSKLGVRCALAAWGYNGEREVSLARERGYLVCELDDVESELFGP